MEGKMDDLKLLRKFRNSGARYNYKAWWRENLKDQLSYVDFMAQVKYEDVKLQDQTRETIKKYLDEG